MQLVARHLQNDRGVVEREENRLRVGVASEAVVAVRRDDAPGRLRRRLLDGRGIIGLFEDVVGHGKPFLDIAEAHLAMIAAVIVVIVAGVMLIDLRGIGLKRFFHVEDRRQNLVVDLHLGRGLLRGALGRGDDGNDRLALETHLPVGKHGLILRPDLDEDEDRVEIVRDVLRRDHPDDARMPLGLGRVDGADQCVMMRTAHHFQMQQVRKGSVGKETGLAGHVVRQIFARPRLTNLVKFLRPFIGEIRAADFHD